MFVLKNASLLEDNACTTQTALRLRPPFVSLKFCQPKILITACSRSLDTRQRMSMLGI